MKKFSNRIEFEADLYRPDTDKPFGFQSCITGFGAIGYTHLSHNELESRIWDKYGAGTLINNAGHLTFRYSKERIWEFPAALNYIRVLQDKAMEAGWCIFLGGGVLNRGGGPDLDLLAYPQTKDSQLKDMLGILPEDCSWSDVGVADVYSYTVGDKLVELIVQKTN